MDEVFQQSLHICFASEAKNCTYIQEKVPVKNSEIVSKTAFFQFTRYNIPAKICHDNLLVTHDPRILATSFPVKLEFKNKNNRNNGTITFS